MAYHTFTAGEVLTASNVMNDLMNQSVIVCTSGTRPASPVNGMLIYETDTLRHVRYNGSTWLVVMTGVTSYTPTFAGLTAGNGTLYGYYTRFADNVCWFYAEILGGSTTTGSCSSVTLPFNVSTPTAMGWFYRWSGSNNNIAGLAHGVGGANTMTFMPVVSTTNNADITPTVGSGDHFVITGTFYAV